MSPQGKLLQSRPGDARSTSPARAGRYGGLVEQAPAVQYAVLGAMATMLKQGFASDLQ